MTKKNLLLDFGNVLAYPPTSHWFISPTGLEIMKKENININRLVKVMDSYNPILSRKVVNTSEEYQMFYDYYQELFSKINCEVSHDTLINLSYNMTYEDDKYLFYDDVESEIPRLASCYHLMLLTDNWPCVYQILKNKNIDKYFEHIYVSSIYGVTKKDRTLFDIPPLVDNIDINNSLFVDDNLELVKIAKEKGYQGILMDRDKKYSKKKVKKIECLKQL